jgi:anti-anti-sigma factor
VVSDVRYGIEVRERGEGGVMVELRGEFDHHNLEDLREALDAVVALLRPAMVDLSGVTFFDIGAIRELAVRSCLHACHLSLRNPSWQIRASVAACGFEEWLDFCFEADDPAYCQAS